MNTCQKDKLKILPKKLNRFYKYMVKHPTETPTDWAWATYDCKDRKVARVIGSQNLTKLNISLVELMRQTDGLTDEDDLQDLIRLRKGKRIIAADVFIRNEKGELKIKKSSNDWIEVDDNPTQLKALELTLKSKGYLKDRIEHSGEIKGAENRVIIIYANKPTESNSNTESRLPTA